MKVQLTCSKCSSTKYGTWKKGEAYGVACKDCKNRKEVSPKETFKKGTF